MLSPVFYDGLANEVAEDDIETTKAPEITRRKTFLVKRFRSQEMPDKKLQQLKRIKGKLAYDQCLICGRKIIDFTTEDEDYKDQTIVAVPMAATKK